MEAIKANTPLKREQSKLVATLGWTALLTGGALAAYGMSRRSPRALAFGLAGGLVALQGAKAGPAAGLFKRELREQRTVTINRPAAELYEFWRNEENTPLWMEHIERVTSLSSTHSRWVMRGHGTPIEWESEITEDRHGHAIAWRSVPGARIEQAGRVEFVELANGRGTEVRLKMIYRMPGGIFGSSLATLLGFDPEQQMRENLRYFKMLMEAGEIATTRGQPHGPRGLKGSVMEKMLGESQHRLERVSQFRWADVRDRILA
jgi:uncharacterized membrane protein